MSIEPRSLVSPGIYRSGQPSSDDLFEFRRMGGKTVLRLNADGMELRIENKLVEQAGMRFIYTPLPGFLAPEHVTVAVILSILRDTKEQPVLVHCYHGEDRTGTIIACLRIDDGWSADKAIEEAKAHHMSWVNLTWFSPMVRFIGRWKP